MRLVVFQTFSGEAIALSPSIARVVQQGGDLYVGGHCGEVYKLHGTYTLENVINEINAALKDDDNER